MRTESANTRLNAVRIIEDWLETGAYPDRALERVTHDRPFLTELVYGIVRWHGALTWMISQMTRELPPSPLMAALEVGLYQLLFMDNVEEYAAVNETVEATKVVGHKAEANMVNAILRRTIRERAEMRRALDHQPLNVRYSHPDILYNRWKREHGERTCRQIFEWNNQPAETIVRVLRGRMSPDAFRRAAQEMGIEVRPHPYSPRNTFIIPRGIAVPDLPGFNDGAFYAQDPATLTPVKLLKPKPGETVLDACASPGGKTVAIAELMKGEGRLVAMDMHDDRLHRLNDNLKRMKFDAFVEQQKGDAKVWQGDTFFDAVLLDVPCSNTGVIRRRPDARWAFDLRRLRGLVDVQNAILTNCATLVKPGGRLVFSTCSLEPEEDESLIQAWLEKHPEFHFKKAEKLLPPKSQTDGAYSALLVRE